MKFIVYFLTAFVCILLQGCQSPSEKMSQLPSSIYLDDQFLTSEPIESASDVFYISPDMKRYVKSRLWQLRSPKAVTTRLINDLFDAKRLGITYARNANYSASDTFDKGLANCMSLTLLSYVLINEAGLEANFMDIEIEENWSIENNLTMVNGHVNLQVSEKKQPAQVNLFPSKYTVDFIPMLGSRTKSKTELTKQQILALYYNNKGADALASGNRNEAYKYFKAGTQLAPTKAMTWGNLASLYRQSGFYQEAEKIYYHALKLEPNNLSIKENLAVLYRATNRNELAKSIYSNIRNKRLKNPYYHEMLGERAMIKGNLTQSLKHFKKAIAINNTEHRFYLGLARVYLHLGEYGSVKSSLKQAQQKASTNQDKEKYQNKIAALMKK